jgi:hypothetical protein
MTIRPASDRFQQSGSARSLHHSYYKRNSFQPERNSYKALHTPRSYYEYLREWHAICNRT